MKMSQFHADETSGCTCPRFERQVTYSEMVYFIINMNVNPILRALSDAFDREEITNLCNSANYIYLS